MDRGRDADVSRFGNTLQPRGNIHAVTKDVMWLNNYVADVDADAEGDASILGVCDCKFVDTGLKLDCSPNSFDRARKLCQRIRRRYFLQCGRRVRLLPGQQHPSGVLSLLNAWPLRHCASAVSSQLRRRPISPITGARPELAAPAPWSVTPSAAYFVRRIRRQAQPVLG